jgi:Domain of unknown function (DUF222)
MTSSVVERVCRVTDLRASFVSHAPRRVPTLKAGLRDLAAIRSWASAAEAAIVRELATVTPIPDVSIAAASRCSVNAVSKTRERSGTLDQAPSFADALHAGTIATGHVDELTHASNKLDDAAQRHELFDRMESLLADAESSTIEQFRRTLSREVNAIQRDDGMERLERQRRSTTLSTWVDNDGMWNLRAKFDPVTGVKLHNRLNTTLETLFAEATPDSCPRDPVETWPSPSSSRRVSPRRAAARNPSSSPSSTSINPTAPAVQPSIGGWTSRSQCR